MRDARSQLRHLARTNGLRTPKTAADFRRLRETDSARTGTPLVDTDLEADAYVSRGRWVTDCPGPDCNAGVAVAPDLPDEAWCGDCGRVFTARFPEPELEDRLRADDVQEWRPELPEPAADRRPS